MTRYQSAQTVALAALIALALSLAGNIRNAFQAHSNCKQIQTLKNHFYAPLIRDYRRVSSGENDQDYKRLYGTEPKIYKGKTYPRWVAFKLEALNEANAQLDQFRPHKCHWISVGGDDE